MCQQPIRGHWSQRAVIFNTMQDTGIMIQQKLNYFRYISSISTHTHTQSQGRPVLMSFLGKDGRQRKKGRLKLALSSVSADDNRLCSYAVRFSADLLQCFIQRLSQGLQPKC